MQVTIWRLVDAALAFFVARLLLIVIVHRRMFTPRYGRGHRLFGLLLLGHLSIGLVDARFGNTIPPSILWIYDATLSLLGLSVSFSAARDFGPSHRHVSNDASGVLDEHATVTVEEMLEHCFYQGLNLVQVLYLHLAPLFVPRLRVCMALGATAPWLGRRYFPVNSFSANYSRPDVGGRTRLIRTLYRLKKYQYIFYKHFLLHGLNASIAVASFSRSGDLVSRPYFRIYWVCLNTAYVCEFFMQTLVKRAYISQRWMLILQQLLMFASTVAALRVLEVVRLLPALISLGLNFQRRGREVSNMAIVLLAARILPPIDHIGDLVPTPWADDLHVW